MDYQIRDQNGYGEISLYDYFIVLKNSKKYILFVFFSSIIFAVIVSYLQPKVYRGEVVLSIMPGCVAARDMKGNLVDSVGCVTARDVKSVLGKLDKDKLENLLLKTHYAVYKMNIDDHPEQKDILHVVIEAINIDIINDIIIEFMAYIDNISLVKKSLIQKQSFFLLQDKELSDLLETSNEMMKTYDRMFIHGKIVFVGFNPLELKMSINYLKTKKFEIENILKQLKGVDIVDKIYISKNPIKPNKTKNISVAAIMSLFVGVILAFVIESIKKTKYRKFYNNSKD
ncbi:MAG: hypothetical protein HQL06_04935 [Nitrospirae bacterium]|nr:hypothetical protein [Nitrospirota bacterium]